MADTLRQGRILTPDGRVEEPATSELVVHNSALEALVAFANEEDELQETDSVSAKSGSDALAALLSYADSEDMESAGIEKQSLKINASSLQILKQLPAFYEQDSKKPEGSALEKAVKQEGEKKQYTLRGLPGYMERSGVYSRLPVSKREGIHYRLLGTRKDVPDLHERKMHPLFAKLLKRLSGDFADLQQQLPEDKREKQREEGELPLLIMVADTENFDVQNPDSAFSGIRVGHIYRKHDGKRLYVGPGTKIVVLAVPPRQRPKGMRMFDKDKGTFDKRYNEEVVTPFEFALKDKFHSDLQENVTVVPVQVPVGVWPAADTRDMVAAVTALTMREFPELEKDAAVVLMEDRGFNSESLSSGDESLSELVKSVEKRLATFTKAYCEDGIDVIKENLRGNAREAFLRNVSDFCSVFGSKTEDGKTVLSSAPDAYSKFLHFCAELGVMIYDETDQSDGGLRYEVAQEGAEGRDIFKTVAKFIPFGDLRPEMGLTTVAKSIIGSRMKEYDVDAVAGPLLLASLTQALDAINGSDEMVAPPASPTAANIASSYSEQLGQLAGGKQVIPWFKEQVKSVPGLASLNLDQLPDSITNEQLAQMMVSLDM